MDVLDQQVVGSAHGLDRRGLALTQEDNGLVAQGGSDGAAGQEQDQAEVGEQRGQLEILVAVAVEVADGLVERVGGHLDRLLADLEVTAAQDLGQLVGCGVVRVREPGALVEPEVEERRRLDDAHVVRGAPQSGVRSSVHTTMLTTSRVSRKTNHGAEKTRKKPNSLGDVHEARADVQAEDRQAVVCRVDLGHLIGIRLGVV